MEIDLSKKEKVTKINESDVIKCNSDDCIILQIKQKNTEQPSYLFCTEIHYLHNKSQGCFDHHIMVYNRKNLIFKVWLPNENEDKEFKNLKEALKSVGMETNYENR